MTKKKILIIENSLAMTGALQSILQNCISLNSIFDFAFVFPSKSACIRLVKEHGFDAYELPMKELSRKPLAWMLYLPSLLTNVIGLKHLLKKTGAHLVHNNDFYNLLPAAYKFLGGHIPYVCHIRFMPSRFPRKLSSLFFSLHARYAEKIIAVSAAVINQLPANKKLVLVHDSLPSQKNDAPFTYDPESKTILYLANYIQGKGQDYALSVFAQLHTRYPNWKLRFAGGDMGLEKNKRFKVLLQKMAQDLGIGAQTEFDDFVTDTRTEYLKCAIVLNFSDSESFSMTCLEAMYYGRPVIATQSGGPSEIITDNVSGLLVPVQDLSAMEAALLTLLSDAGQRKLMAAAAYTSARDRFGRKQFDDKLLGVYLPLVEKYSGKGDL